MINYDLLLDCYAYVRLTPKDWDQSVWRCSTGQCFAGWAVTLADLEWLVPHRQINKNDGLSDMVVVQDKNIKLAGYRIDKTGEYIRAAGMEDDVMKKFHKDEREIATAEDVAQAILGLGNSYTDDYATDRLFNSDNEVYHIREILTDIIGYNPDSILDRRVNRTDQVSCTFGQLMGMKKAEIADHFLDQFRAGLVMAPQSWNLTNYYTKIQLATMCLHCDK